MTFANCIYSIPNPKHITYTKPTKDRLPRFCYFYAAIGYYQIRRQSLGFAKLIMNVARRGLRGKRCEAHISFPAV